MRLGVAVCCAASLVACTSMRVVLDTNATVPGLPAPLQQQQLAADDMLRVSMRDGQVIDLHLTAVAAGMLDGVDAATDQPVHLPVEQIARVERRVNDPAKTVLLVAAVSVGIFLTVRLVQALVTLFAGARW